MGDPNQTNVIKICGACGMDLQERDKYCRRCGVKQSTPVDGMTSLITVNNATRRCVTASNFVDYLPAATTSALSEADTYRKVSGPLVEAVTAGITERAFSKFRSQLVRQSLSALLSIPIWLMLILLSPFDAYIAAKHISSQATHK